MTNHKRQGTTWEKHTFTDHAFCGFKYTVPRDFEDPATVLPFTHKSCVSSCQDCEDAYALALLGELP